MQNIRHDHILEGMLVTLRGSLAACPEVAGSEVMTSTLIANFLHSYAPDKLLTHLGGYGIAAVYEGQHPGPTVMIRCELDGLPVEEADKNQWLVQGANIAHRCGHDGHMAIVAGLAPLLHRTPPSCGRVVLLFQPAEETGAGARAIIGDPNFEKIRPDCAITLHNLPGFPRGHIVYRRGTFASASVGMRVRLLGQASHAAEPEQARSPANAVRQLLAELPQLSRVTDNPYCMLTLTHAQLGLMSFGLTPGEATVCATLRAASAASLQTLRREAEQCVRDCAAAELLFAEVEWVQDFPATVNDDALVDALERVCHDAGIVATELPKPFRWSEDFGHFAGICPILHFGLGIGEHAPGLHQPDYEFCDDTILVAVSAYHEMVNSLLLGYGPRQEKIATGT
ncbi:MAG: amidohydrolase [Nitrospirota bacterium]|nr:amidohydrolase [Nitrospirota bacterium]MDH5700076.1 amidohydrolase [Nitrospirota bacterium]